jgi:MFS family permease
MGLFAASYVVFHRGGATLEVQLVGTSFFAPMFIGGLAGGVIADRFDRRRVLVLQLWLLAGVSLLYHIAMSILHSRRVQHRGMR